MKLRRVENLDRRFGSAPRYYHLRLDIPDDDTDEVVDLLFSESALKTAAARAQANPEDYMSLNPNEGRVMEFIKALVGL